jgi:alkylhydroperoxidase family enzyme
LQRQLDDLDLFENSPAFSDLEKDVLRFADQWTRLIPVDRQLLERLRQALSPADLVTLAATVAQANLTSRFNVVFDIPLP